MIKLLGIVGLSIVPAVLAAQSLRGSQASVDLMYTAAHVKDLAFLQTPADVYEAVKLGELQLILVTNDLSLEGAKYPFVLPNTRRFADSLAVAYHTGCGERLVVTSGVRPVDGQPRNASPESVHPTGMAIDFRKPAGRCLTWLRTNLLTLEDHHVIEATEEHHPPHFHVAVLHQAPELRHAVFASAAPPPSASTARSPRLAATPNIATALGEVTKRPSPALATSMASKPSASSASASGTTQPRTTASTPSATSELSYRVRAGDNLWIIAERHGTTVKQIQTVNGFRTTRLRVGQQIKLP